MGSDIAEDPTRRPILVSVPNSSPIKRYRQNTISMHETSGYDHFLSSWDATSKFASFDLKNKTSYFHDIYKPTESEPSFVLFFSDKLRSLCIFPDICIGLISPTKTTKKGLLSICGLVHDPTPCKKIASKYRYVVLSGAWAINRFGSTLAGPACCRDEGGTFPQV